MVKSQVGIEDVVNAVHEVLDQNTGVETSNIMNAESGFNQPIEGSGVFQVQQQVEQYTIPQNQPQAEQYTVSQNQPQVEQYTVSQNQPQAIQQQMTQSTATQQLAPDFSNQQAYEQPNTAFTQQTASQGPSFNQVQTPVPQNTQTPSPQNDAYSINSVTDESGMNIKDQMDQILGGMGSI